MIVHDKNLLIKSGAFSVWVKLGVVSLDLSSICLNFSLTIAIHKKCTYPSISWRYSWLIYACLYVVVEIAIESKIVRIRFHYVRLSQIISDTCRWIRKEKQAKCSRTSSETANMGACLYTCSHTMIVHQFFVSENDNHTLYDWKRLVC